MDKDEEKKKEENQGSVNIIYDLSRDVYCIFGSIGWEIEGDRRKVSRQEKGIKS